MNIKYKLSRLYIKFKKRGKIPRFVKNLVNENTGKVDVVENKAIEILTQYVKDRQNILLMDPHTEKRYVQKFDDYPFITANKIPELFIKLERYKLIIIDHKNYYDFTLLPEVYQTLVYEFDKEVVRRTRKMEYEIRTTVISNLDNILNKVITVDNIT